MVEEEEELELDACPVFEFVAIGQGGLQPITTPSESEGVGLVAVSPCKNQRKQRKQQVHAFNCVLYNIPNMT